MAVMIDSWPLPQMPLRFLRISRGTYQTIIGAAPQQTRYTIARQPRRWRVERSLQQPGGDWAIVSVQPAESLKGAIEWCDVDVRENGALRSPAAAGRLGARARCGVSGAWADSGGAERPRPDPAVAAS